jgi:pilus assembly protein CpaC
MMKHISILLILSQFSQAQILKIGQSQEIPSTQSKVWAKKNDCIDIQILKNTVKVTGLKKCSVKIKVDNQYHKIQVITDSQHQLMEKVSEQVKKIPGLKANYNNSDIEIQGQLFNWQNWKTLRDLNDIENSFFMRAQLSDGLKETFQSEINKELQSEGLLPFNVSLHPVLSISLHPDQQYKDRYMEYFKKLGIAVSLAKESLASEPTIQVKIRILEVSKSSSHNFGIRWPDEVSFDVLPSRIVTSETLQAKLMAMESNGEARTLASPTLICRSGKEAEFFAGGEYPIRLKGLRAESLQWIKYGVGLKIRPVADSSGRISLSLDTEISNLSAIVENIPTVETSRVSSHFDLAKSQVVALSGILRDQNSSGHDGIPLLKNIPVLGSLFSSKKYLSKQSELVILVEPRLMNQPGQL